MEFDISDVPDSDARALVCVVTRPKDLDLIRREGWYRIPLRRAPPSLAVELLAFYQTAAFGAERWAVRWIAPIRRISLATRGELLPDEPRHPRAAERYYRFELGALRSLPAAVPSRRLRRISFILTSYGQLLRATELCELWRPPEAARADEVVWGAGVGRR